MKINIISYLENQLSENVIIKKLEYETSVEAIEIYSPIEKLFSKKSNYKMRFSSNEKISFHSKIISKESVSGIIGDFKRSEGYIEKDIKTFIENSKK